MIRIVTGFLLLFAGVASVSGQQVIFNDDFALDPSANSWVENVATTNTATGDISPTGTAAEFAKVGGTGTVTNSILRTVDTSGFRNIEIELVAFQSNTLFEGGLINQNNTDSLSIYVDIGGGFTPVMQRTGVWGAGGPGFSDGGSGSGIIVPTSTGFLIVGAGAANNPNVQVRIESISSAAAEDYFIDDFTVRGTRIPPVVVAAEVISGPDEEDPVVLLTDLGAIDSLLNSGLPIVSALKEVNHSTVRAAGRDINERLYRLRSGLGVGDFGQLEAVHPSGKEVVRTPMENQGKSVLPKEMVVPQQSGTIRGTWNWFATGDFGQTEQDPVRDAAAFEGETYSSSVGVEYSAGEDWAIGFAWTYLESDTEFSNQLGNMDITGNTGHAYATWLPTEDSYLSLRYGYSDLENSISRRTGLGTTAYGNPGADLHSVDLDGGYHFRFGAKSRQWVTGPMFGLEYADGGIDGFSETGATRGALDVASQSYESLLSRVGWQVSKRLEFGKHSVIPQLRLAWEHEHGTAADSVAVQLQQSPFVLARGGKILGRGGDFAAAATQANAGRDYLSAGAGFRILLDESISIAFDYEGHFFRDDQTAHFGGVRISAGF